MKARNITAQVRPIYRAAFPGETLPRGVRVWLVERITGDKRISQRAARGGRFLGLCGWENIYLSRRAWRERNGRWSPIGSGWLGTLLHEWVHLRCPDLRHGAEFAALVAAAHARVWQEGRGE